MPDFNLARLPSGDRQWRHFLQWASAVDDSAESHYLEFKSDVDLNTKEGKVKVAKFILGAANRSPEVASRYFEGRAVMVLGVSHGSLTGIAPFERKDLESEVTKYTGVPGPQWDRLAIDLGSGRNALIIIVDPPVAIDQPWTCRQSTTGLRDGAIYLRVDGATREATGDEIRAIIDRVKSRAEEAQLRVSVVGPATRYICDNSVVDDYIAKTTRLLLDAYPEPQKTDKVTSPEAADIFKSAADLLGGIDNPTYKAIRELRNAFPKDFLESLAQPAVRRNDILGSLRTEYPDPRSKEDYKTEIQAWASRVRAQWPRTLDRVAAYRSRATRLRIDNLGQTFLTDLELHVHIDGQVEAASKPETNPKQFRPTKNMPKPPRKWGPIVVDNYGVTAAGYIPRNDPAVRDLGRPRYGTVSFENGGSVDLPTVFEKLRPEATAWTEDNEFVLICRDNTLAELTGSWRATAAGHHMVYTGNLVVEVDEEIHDLTDFMRQALRLDRNP